jgi:hypothetical protein
METAWIIIGFAGAALMWATQVGPKQAISHAADWAVVFGCKNPPYWLRSENADRVLRHTGALILLVSVLYLSSQWIGIGNMRLGSKILFGIGAGALVGAIFWNLFGPNIYSWLPRDPQVAVLEGQLSALRATPVLATHIQPTPESAKQPELSGNPLREAIDAFLAKNGKTIDWKTSVLIQTPDANDGKGAYIAYWDQSMGPWPEPIAGNGFTADQLRKLPRKVPRFSTQFDKEEFRKSVRDVSTVIKQVDDLIKASRNVAGVTPITGGNRADASEPLEKLRKIRETFHALDGQLFRTPIFDQYPDYKAELWGLIPPGSQDVFQNFGAVLNELTNAVALLREVQKLPDNVTASAQALEAIKPIQDRFAATFGLLQRWVVDCNQRIDMVTRAI